MTETWSPVCQKCGGRGNAEVTPPANMIFAGRLRPEATKPFKFGDRVRCTRCNAWFTLSAGTEWRSTTKLFRGALPQRVKGEPTEMLEGEGASDETLGGQE